ncbi:hypothetical protein ES702_00116 [subsurface metagenome]
MFFFYVSVPRTVICCSFRLDIDLNYSVGVYSYRYPETSVKSAFSTLVVLADTQPDSSLRLNDPRAQRSAQSNTGGGKRGTLQYSRPLTMRQGANVFCISKLSVARISESVAVSIDTNGLDGRPLVRLHHPPLDDSHPNSAAVEYFAFDHDFTTLIDHDGMFTKIRGAVDKFLAGSSVGLVSEGCPGMYKANTLFHGPRPLLFSIVRYLTGRTRRPHHQLQLRVIDVNGWDVHDLIADRPRRLVSPSNLQQTLTRFEVEPVDDMDEAFVTWWQIVYGRRSGRHIDDDHTSQLVVVVATHFPAPNVMVLLDQAVSMPRVGDHNASVHQQTLTNVSLEASHEYLRMLNDDIQSEQTRPPVWGLLSTLLPAEVNTDIVVIFHLSTVDYSSSRYLLLYKRELERYSAVRKRSFSVSESTKSWRVMTPVLYSCADDDGAVVIGGAPSRRGYETD